MKALRLAIVMGLITVVLGVTPAALATDCSDSKPQQQCGGCQLNRDFSLDDPRPIVCYF